MKGVFFMSKMHDKLFKLIENKDAVVGIIGLAIGAADCDKIL